MYIVRLDSKEADIGDGADNHGIKRNTNKKQSAKQKLTKNKVSCVSKLQAHIACHVYMCIHVLRDCFTTI